MMAELKEKAQAIIDQYTPALAQKGLKILLSKRYFETDVDERGSSNPSNPLSALFMVMDRATDRKSEIENGYNYERNKYHLFVLLVLPLEKNALRRDECREYAFVLQMVVRAHIGQEPRRITHKEPKILSKIEKRILKILKKAEKSSALLVCRNNIFDAFRYALHPKYEYKESFLGKERLTWEIIFIVAACLVVFGTLFVAWLLTK